MSLFTRILKAVYNEVRKPASFVRGEEFEQYLRNEIFTQLYYDIDHRSHDYSVNHNDYVGDSMFPDFIFCEYKSERLFAVEAKYRSYFYEDAVEWCKPRQLARYKDFSTHMPTLVALGVGGEPKYPDHLYIFNVASVKYPKLFKKTLKPYEVKVDHEVQPGFLWKKLVSKNG